MTKVLSTVASVVFVLALATFVATLAINLATPCEVDTIECLYGI